MTDWYSKPPTPRQLRDAADTIRRWVNTTDLGPGETHPATYTADNLETAAYAGERRVEKLGPVDPGDLGRLEAQEDGPEGFTCGGVR